MAAPLFVFWAQFRPSISIPRRYALHHFMRVMLRACVVTGVTAGCLVQTACSSLNVRDETVGGLVMERGSEPDFHFVLSDAAKKLHRAVADSDLRTVQALVAKGADVNATTSTGDTPLHLAVKAVSDGLVRKLLEAGADPDALNWSGQSPLYVAAHTNDLIDAEILLRHGASLGSPDGVPSPLEEAVNRGHDRVAGYLIDQGADTETIESQESLRKLKNSGLHEVLARIQHTDDYAVGVARSELYDWLRSAIAANSSEKVQRLLDLGVECGPSCILNVAVRLDANAVIFSLLERGKVLLTDLRSGHLATAAEHDSVRVAQLLVETADADVDARTDLGWTPLHSALVPPGAGMRGTRVARLLIRAGAEVNAATAAMGWTPLHFAAALGDSEIVGALLAAGAEVNPRTRLGHWTPLYVAQQLGTSGLKVAAMLRAEGGVSSRNQQLTDLPVYVEGEADPRWLVRDGDAWTERRSIDEIHDRLYTLPIYGGGGTVVKGSFSTPGARERLVIEWMGVHYDFVELRLVTLVNENNKSSLAFVTDNHMYFEELCLNPSGIHSAVFTRSFGGAGGGSQTVYMHFDMEAGTLREAYADRREADSGSKTCIWGEQFNAETTFHLSLLPQLDVGALADIGDSAYDAEGTPVSLPTKVIATETVETVLAAIEALPHGVGRVERNDLGGSFRWQTVVVSDPGSQYGSRGGAALLWDAQRGQWRSFYDEEYIEVVGLDGEMLIVGALSRDCGFLRSKQLCYFEIDLNTFDARRLSGVNDRLLRLLHPG